MRIASLYFGLSAVISRAIVIPEADFMLDIHGISVGVESGHICVLEEKLGEEIGGRASCFGFQDETGRLDPPPDGIFVQVVTGKQYGCGINLDQTVTCWGYMPAPTGLFTQLVGEDFYLCGLQTDNRITCNGNIPFSVIPSDRRFVQLSCGGAHCCALDDTAVPHCWPSLDEKACPYIVPPTIAVGGSTSEEEEEDDLYEDEEDEMQVHKSGDRVKIQMKQIAASDSWTCGLSLQEQDLHCWGHKRMHKKNPERHPPKLAAGPFKQVAVGGFGVCAIRESGQKDRGGKDISDSLECWGLLDTIIPAADKMAGWDQISVGQQIACGVSMNSELKCWGLSAAIIDALEIPPNLVIA